MCCSISILEIDVQFNENKSLMTLIRRSPSLPQQSMNFRMISTWTLGDTDITVQGTVETALEGLATIPFNVVYTTRDSEEDENDWERSVRLEAETGPSQSIVLDAVYLPNKIEANMTTPFLPFKSLAFSLDSQTVDSRTDVDARLKVNDGADSLHLTGHINFIENEIILELNLTSSFSQFKQAQVKWKAEFEELPSISSYFSVDSYRVQFDLPLDDDSVGLHLKVETPLQDHGLYELKLYVDTNSGHFLLVTPFQLLSKAEILAKVNLTPGMGFSLSVLVDNFSRTTKFQLEASDTEYDNDTDKITGSILLQIPEIVNFEFGIEVDDRPNKEFLTINCSIGRMEQFQWGFHSKLKEIEDTSIDLEVDVSSIDRRWLLGTKANFKNESESAFMFNFTIAHQEATYFSSGLLIKGDNNQSGMIEFQWPDYEPLQLNFSTETKAYRVGTGRVIINTPWTTTQPALIVGVEFDARQVPVIVKMKALAAGDSMELDVLAAYTDISTITGKASGNISR